MPSRFRLRPGLWDLGGPACFFDFSQPPVGTGFRCGRIFRPTHLARELLGFIAIFQPEVRWPAAALVVGVPTTPQPILGLQQTFEVELFRMCPQKPIRTAIPYFRRSF